MGTKVFANMRGVVHKDSGGMSMVFPDVCKTPAPPAPPIPIPYPNIGQASDTTGGPSAVTTDGQMPMVKGAKYMKSSGDEAGTLGGVMSMLTVSTTGLDVAALPAASYARTVQECAPLSAPVNDQSKV